MSKLPNIIEKERSLWTVIVFALKQSIKGSPKYSIIVYLTSVFRASLLFIQFGGLGIIINEFTRAGIRNARPEVIALAFGLIVLGTLIPSLLSSVQSYSLGVQNNDLQRYLQKLVFEKMHTLDIGTVEQPEFQNISEVARNRGWAAVFQSISNISNSLGNVTALIIAMISLLALAPLILVILIVTAIPTYILEKRNAERDGELWKKRSEERRAWVAKSDPLDQKDHLIELKNFNLVKIFGTKWEAAISSYHRESKEINKKSFWNEFIGDLLIIVGYIASFALIIFKIYNGGLLLGSLIFTFTVISRFQSALQALFENFGRLNEQKKYLNTFMDFLEIKPNIISGTKAISKEIPIVIEFKNVSFSYPATDRIVLENISLKISPGDNIAIVGLNGAGKTTLIKLLTRVYDPTEGEILVNKIPLREYDLRSWKECLSILLQEYSIYSEETVEENIMLGDTSKHEHADVIRSANETTISETIETLPNKYGQRVGTEFRGGVEFSKGQKQKLALARVLYRTAPIMILDEPTASIDAVSEDTIFKNLKANHLNQTRIVISHKFSNVRDADQIILIKDGKIFEKGNHEKLMNMKRGVYKKLFELQAEGYR